MTQPHELFREAALDFARNLLKELEKDEPKAPEPEDSAPEESPVRDPKTFAEEVQERAGVKPTYRDPRYYLLGSSQIGNQHAYPLQDAYENTTSELEEASALSLVRAQEAAMAADSSYSLWADILLRDTFRILAQGSLEGTRNALLELAVTVDMWADTIDGMHE